MSKVACKLSKERFYLGHTDINVEVGQPLTVYQSMGKVLERTIAV